MTVSEDAAICAVGPGHSSTLLTDRRMHVNGSPRLVIDSAVGETALSLLKGETLI